MNRIDALFSKLRHEKRRALMPFVTAGDPDLPTTALLISELVASGAHLVEIGFPYSDPIADGPVIAASYHRALEHGVKLARVFDLIRTFRAGVRRRSTRRHWWEWSPSRLYIDRASSDSLMTPRPPGWMV